MIPMIPKTKKRTSLARTGRPCAQLAITTHLNSLAGQLEEASGDGHYPGVLRVKRGQECRGVAVEVLLVVDETLGEEGHVALPEVVDDGTLAAVLLHERHPQLVALDGVQHLHIFEGESRVCELFSHESLY